MANEKDIGVAAGRRAPETGRGLVDETGRAIVGGTERVAEAMRRVADAAPSAGNEVPESVRRIGDAAASIGHETAETARRTTEAVGEVAGDVVNRSAEQMRRFAGLPVQEGEAVLVHASRNLDLMVRCGSVFADGAQSFWREVASTSRAAVERRMSGLSQAAGVRTVSDLMAVQDRLAREEIGSLLGSGRRIAELSVRIAQDAAERLAENPVRQRPAPTQDRI